MTVRDARRLARGLDLGAPPTSAPQEYGAPVAVGEALTVVRGATVALKDASVRLRPGTVTALMGRNGSGKSTLLWTLQGSRERRAGRVEVSGTDPARRRRPCAVPSSGWCRRPPPTCSTSRPSPRSAWPPTAARGRPASSSTGWCPTIPDDTHPRDLSEGQRLALALVVVLVGAPPVLLLDEPTRGLDYPAKAELAAVLRVLADDGHAVMVATHDVEFAAVAADQVVVLAEGEVVSDGPTREVLAASPAFAPQVTKILGPGWLRVDEVPR